MTIELKVYINNILAVLFQMTSWIQRYKDMRDELENKQEMEKNKTKTNAWANIVKKNIEKETAENIDANIIAGISENIASISSTSHAGCLPEPPASNIQQTPVSLIKNKYTKSPYTLYKKSWRDFINTSYHFTDNYDITVGEWVAIFVGTYLQPLIEKYNYKFICSGKQVANCLMNNMYEIYYSYNTLQYSQYRCKHDYFDNDDFNNFMNTIQYSVWYDLQRKMIEMYNFFSEDGFSSFFWSELPLIVFSHVENINLYDNNNHESTTGNNNEYPVVEYEMDDDD